MCDIIHSQQVNNTKLIKETQQNENTYRSRYAE